MFTTIIVSFIKRTGSDEACRVLMESGADVEAVDSDGLTDKHEISRTYSAGYTSCVMTMTTYILFNNTHLHCTRSGCILFIKHV